VAEVRETKCVTQNVITNECGDGFGNHIVINTPEGTKLLLAHLFPESIPSNIIGLTTTSGGGKGLSSMQASPVAQGLLMETSFKGVPRALRIIPGRTILSFVSNYDSWVENGGPRGRDNGTDPGIWIPARFKNWFVKTCDYKWRDGDLRVSIEGASQWGTSQTNVPTFPEYIKSLRESGEIKSTGDYYGYIRSIGDLHWKAEDPKDGKLKDSTEIECPEAQAWAEAFSGGDDSTQPTGVNASFPSANCRTGDPVKDQIIKALYSLKITNPFAIAGVLGNLEEESGFNQNVHNTPIQGFTCVTDRSNPPAGRPEKCYGLAQWGGIRKINAVRKCGQVSTLQCQLEFIVQEIKQGTDASSSTPAEMNKAKSPQEGADLWNRFYERGSGGIQKRRDFAVKNFRLLKCDRPTQ
jgi:hypothetical protein